MKALRKFFRGIASALVTYQTNRIYRKAVVIADRRHAAERTTIYVAEDLLDPRRLATYDRKQFRRIKEVMKRRDPLYSVVLMKHGSYYHTADAGENGGLTEKEKEIRRLALVRLALKRARLA